MGRGIAIGWWHHCLPHQPHNSSADTPLHQRATGAQTEHTLHHQGVTGSLHLAQAHQNLQRVGGWVGGGGGLMGRDSLRQADRQKSSSGSPQTRSPCITRSEWNRPSTSDVSSVEHLGVVGQCLKAKTAALTRGWSWDKALV